MTDIEKVLTEVREAMMFATTEPLPAQGEIDYRIEKALRGFTADMPARLGKAHDWLERCERVGNAPTSSEMQAIFDEFAKPDDHSVL